jgi:hypothetical protein
MRSLAAIISVAAAVAGLTGAALAADKPKIPVLDGDPAKPTVAIIADGVDYMRASLAQVLRRDGELELIGWDFVDNDQRPYAPATAVGTRLAQALSTHARLVPLRINPADPQQLAKAIGFASRAPLRVVALPLINTNPVNWQVLLAASVQFPNLLFVAPADETMAPALAAETWQRAGGATNVLVVAGPDWVADAGLTKTDGWHHLIDVTQPCPPRAEQKPEPMPQADATSAIAGMVRHLLAAESGRQQVEPAGADLKRRLIDYAGYGKPAAGTDPGRSGWRLITGCINRH